MLYTQGIVDDLARRLGRAALVEDLRQRVVLYTEHNEPADDLRRLTILRRQRPPEVVEWFRSRGVYESRRPVRVPECPRLAMLPRVCVPLQHGDSALGLVSFVDAGDLISDDEIALAARLAADLGLELHRERAAAELASRREVEAVRELLLGPDDGRTSAARALVEEERIRPPEGVVAVVVRPAGEPGDELRETLAGALEAARRWFGPRECLLLIRYDHGVLLVTAGADRAEELAAHASSALGDRPLVVGVGEARRQLADARESYAEALRASEVGAVLPGVGRIAHWSELGVYRVLAELAAHRSFATGVHPGLEELFGDENKAPLLETLEAFLDLAGNVHATAARLHLHRATLYYRLDRIAQLAPANLKDGNERLCLHLALKVGRLTGRYRPRLGSGDTGAGAAGD